MRTYLLAFALFLSYSLVEAVTFACSYGPNDYLAYGLLGRTSGDPTDTWLLPRNFAVLGSVPVTRDGDVVVFSAPDTLGLTRPVSPLEAGAPDQLTLEFTPAADDQTPAARMTYAFYLGESPDTLPTEPYMLVVTSGSETRLAGLYGFVDEDDRYVALAAIDQAGNVGPLSAAIRIAR